METEKKYNCGISGYVKEGYEPVIEAMERAYKIGHDKRSQLCAYVKGEKVVDVVMNNVESMGCGPEAKPITADTITSIFSSGKSVASILMAIMVDQGHCKYEEPVATYWPEFAKNGKEKITIADLGYHEAGLSKLSQPVDVTILNTDNL